AVLPPLLLDLTDMDLADLAGTGDMRAAAGLTVYRGIVAYADEAYAASPDGRPDILRLHQDRICGKLLVGDPARENRMISGDEFLQLGGDVFLRHPGIRQVEVDARILLAHCRAGDRKGTDDGKQMTGRVHAHQ